MGAGCQKNIVAVQIRGVHYEEGAPNGAICPTGFDIIGGEDLPPEGWTGSWNIEDSFNKRTPSGENYFCAKFKITK